MHDLPQTTALQACHCQQQKLTGTDAPLDAPASASSMYIVHQMLALHMNNGQLGGFISLRPSCCTPPADHRFVGVQAARLQALGQDPNANVMNQMRALHMNDGQLGAPKDPYRPPPPGMGGHSLYDNLGL